MIILTLLYNLFAFIFGLWAIKIAFMIPGVIIGFALICSHKIIDEFLYGINNIIIFLRYLFARQ